MAPRRPVRVSDPLIEHAEALFPRGGSVSGAPSFDTFELGPLAAAKLYFARRFDEAPDLVGGIKVWVTMDLPFFPPMAFYAALVAQHVELLDVTIEDPQDYWAMIEEDRSP